MSDIDRPLRRLEIARRIQELRDRATQDAAPTGIVGPEDAGPEIGVTQVALTAPRHLARGDTDDVPDGTEDAPDGTPDVPEELLDDVLPAGRQTNLPDEDSSAAATIASLLRGGQTWLLDRGR